MKKLRKRNTQKGKQARKDAQRELKKSVSLMLKHPTECSACGQHFERTQATVKTWQVVVVEGRVRLSCPECWSAVNKIMENHNGS